LTRLLAKESNLLIMLITLSCLVRLFAMSSTHLLAEEAYYWNYANHLDLSYLDHPPMVAFLIKLFTIIWGTNEIGVRFASLLCWFICALFSYKLTELIKPTTGKNAVLLLAILPFFFLYSMVMTPDLPLIACWSATLYYLYLALVQQKTKAWYFTGIWLGLGMLSKYTIALLGVAALTYILTVRDARHWFLSPAPYIAVLMTVIIFSPVIYWNATHEWASFVFQSTHRLNAHDGFSFHALVGLFVLFLTPLGVWGFSQLFKSNAISRCTISTNTQRFLQLFTLIPLLVFALFSLAHAVKFNWIGPGLLAIIPWLALQMDWSNQSRLRPLWLLSGTLLLTAYIGLVCCTTWGKPAVIYRSLFTKYIDWSQFSYQINDIAAQLEEKFKQPVLLIPLDHYSITSELAFYQAKLVSQNKNSHQYPVISAERFGYGSLMYRYWSQGEKLTNKTILLIATEAIAFTRHKLVNEVDTLLPQHVLWAQSPGSGSKVMPYYYQAVTLRI